MRDYHAGTSTVSDQVLPRCWVPRELARRWFGRRDLPWPRRFDPVVGATALTPRLGPIAGDQMLGCYGARRGRAPTGFISDAEAPRLFRPGRGSHLPIRIALYPQPRIGGLQEDLVAVPLRLSNEITNCDVTAIGHLARSLFYDHTH
jgi:hypothetical protein